MILALMSIFGSSLLLSNAARAISINDGIAPTASDVANYYDSGNTYPNVVALYNDNTKTAFCTGTLINSRTVLTAAHCFGNVTPSISFDPNAGAGTPVSSIIINKDYAGGINDIALISLSKPAENVTPVTLMPSGMKPPAPGALLTMVGYGVYGNGTWCCDDNNRRRIATTELGAYQDSGGQLFYLAQFRDPKSPKDPNYFELTAGVSKYEGGVNGGDSGGPIFVNTANGLVEIGVLRGGIIDTKSTYGGINEWTPVNLFLDWIAKNNPLRQVNNATGDFNWNNPTAWVDAVPGMPGSFPDNSVKGLCVPARYYQVTLNNTGKITLNMSPTIDALTISGPKSVLRIPQTYTLTSLISFTLQNGQFDNDGLLITRAYRVIGGINSGVGTVKGNVDFGPGSKVDPGHSIGTFHVDGSVTFEQGATYIAQVNPSGRSDLLSVTGNTKANGLVAVMGDGSGASLLPRNRYTILSSAGGVTGTFNSASIDLSFLTTMLTYDADNVYLTFDRVPFAVAASNINQRNVANALSIASYGQFSSDGQAVLDMLYSGPRQNAPSVFDAVGGAGLAGVRSTAMLTAAMAGSAISDQAAFWRSGETSDGTGVTSHEGAPSGALAYAPIATINSPIVVKAPPAFERRWRAW